MDLAHGSGHSVSGFSGDASDFFRLADDLTDVAADMVPALRGGMESAGVTVANVWKKKAASIQLSGESAKTRKSSHIKKFPDSISSELKFGGFGSVTVEVGPNEGAANQGFLGPILEFGGTKSPAYMHGDESLRESEGKIAKVVADALDPLF